MKSLSYLLALDGSQESQLAAYFAWELAIKTRALVIAQHVVDSKAIWRLLSYNLAGFIGSGPYLDAKEKITEALHSIGEVLMLAYGSQADGRSLPFETYIDEGEPADEIARRALDHDLVIIGYHERKSNNFDPRLYEMLAENCPCPVLVVRDVSKKWSKMRIFMTKDIADLGTIGNIHQLGNMLGLDQETYLERGLHRFEDCHPVGVSPSPDLLQMKCCNLKDVLNSASSDILLAVPAKIVTSSYDAQTRDQIQTFLERSDRPALLLWPQSDSFKAKEKLAA